MEDQQLNHSFQNQSSEQVKCLLCKTIPEQYISLDCKDDFCLICLAKKYFETKKFITKKKKSKEINTYEVFCPLCNKITVLDQLSIDALESTLIENNITSNENEISAKKETNEVILEESTESFHNEDFFKNGDRNYSEARFSFSNKNNKIIDSEKEIKINSEKERIEKSLKNLPFEINTSSPNQFNNISPQSKSFYCENHQKEQANLFCFNCENKCFCNVCYLNGIHKNHNVKNIEKCKDFIIEKMNEIKIFIEKKSNFLNENIQKLESRKKIILDKVQENKEIIITEFREIKEKINLKEEELINLTENFGVEKVEQITPLLNEIKSQKSILKDLEQSFQFQNIKNDQMVNYAKMFNLFSDKKTIIRNFIETDLNKFLNSNNINDFKCHLDLQSFYNFLENIHIIKLEISNLNKSTSQNIDNSENLNEFNGIEKNLQTSENKKDYDSNLIINTFSSVKTNAEINSSKFHPLNNVGLHTLNTDNKIIKNKQFFSSFEERNIPIDFSKEKKKFKSPLNEYLQFYDKRFQPLKINFSSERNLFYKNDEYKLTSLNKWDNKRSINNSRKSKDFRNTNFSNENYISNLEKQKKLFERQKEYFFISNHNKKLI